MSLGLIPLIQRIKESVGKLEHGYILTCVDFYTYPYKPPILTCTTPFNVG